MKTGEHLVSWNIGKLLKKHGFDWPCQTMCITSIKPDWWKKPETNSQVDNEDEFMIPTVGAAMQWLREELNYVVQPMLDSYVEGCEPMGYYVVVSRYNDPWYEASPSIPGNDKVFFKTWEEAAEYGIEYVLKYVIGESNA